MHRPDSRPPADAVKTVLLRIPLRGDAGLLEFVEYHDGTLAAHRDGRRVASHHWPASEFQQALQAITDLQRRLERRGGN